MKESKRIPSEFRANEGKKRKTKAAILHQKWRLLELDLMLSLTGSASRLHVHGVEIGQERDRERVNNYSFVVLVTKSPRALERRTK